MSLIEGLASLIIFAWLVRIAWFDIRTRQVPNILWTGIPLLLAAAYRLLSGDHQLIVAAAVVVVLVTERRHLQQKVLEWVILIAAIIALVWIMFTVDLPTAYAVVGTIIFWIAWERKYIGGADAMALITCLIVWPGLEFQIAYLIAGLGYSLAVRIKEGGWLKAHPSPGLLIVAIGAGLYILWQSYLVFRRL